jgi:hypothetical protein
MNPVAIVLGCSLVLGSSAAIAQQPRACTGPQLGTWKLQTLTTEDLETHRKTNPLGAHPNGYLSYGTDCRMSAILVSEDRKAPVAAVATDAEAIALYRSSNSYAGTYTIDGDRVSHHVDTDMSQTWTGTTQVRQFKIEGNSLQIITLPAKNIITGRQSTSVLIWTKVE